MKKKIYLILTLVWVGVIFSFSLQTGQVSGTLSGGLGRWMLDKALWMFGTSVENLSAETFEILHFLLRKCCHFGEFLVLGVLSLQTVRRLDCIGDMRNVWRRCLIAFIFCIIIASIDESLQLLVDGRAGRVMDVLIDSSGSLAGIVIFNIRKISAVLGK